jgi:uncharacterized protein
MVEQQLLPVTERTRVRRLPERQRTERAALHAVLDEGLICHLAFVVDGSPVVLPTAYGRDGDVVYLHGSTGSRWLRALAAGAPLCLGVTLLDGLVLARSGMHSSMNYRSAVVFGHATEVTGDAAKRHALRVVIEHLAPGRWEELRPITRKELAATLVVAVPLDEASVKVRTGAPKDDEEDLDLPIWSGVLPLSLMPGRPEPDPTVPSGIPVPPSVRGWVAGAGDLRPPDPGAPGGTAKAGTTPGAAAVPARLR